MPSLPCHFFDDPAPTLASFLKLQMVPVRHMASGRLSSWSTRSPRSCGRQGRVQERRGGEGGLAGGCIDRQGWVVVQ